MNARDEVLRRIRSALEDVAGSSGAPLAAEAIEYRRNDPTVSRVAVVEMFAAHVAEYQATVTRVAAEELDEAIARALSGRGVRRLVVPADVPAEWLASSRLASFEVIADQPEQPLAPADLDASDGVLTGCRLGIAQTGTIVLDGGPSQGRRALSLVPDYHLCVVFAAQIVNLVPEAIAQLAASQTRPMTFISGPSATSDIELSRVEGVHGPRTLDVLVVEA